MVFFSDQYDFGDIIEFGSGDGLPVLNALAGRPYINGSIAGYELNDKAAALACGGARAMDLHDIYQVHNSCFFKGVAASNASTLISNPPYIAAPDDDIMMPALHGGTDGSNLTRDLMSMGFDNAMLLVCSYCDPIRTIAHAKNEGYSVVDYRVTALPFGTYSSEPKVLNWISQMRDEGRAFFSPGSYRLAGVLLRKDASPESNETQEWSSGSGSGSVRSASDASGSSGTFATSTDTDQSTDCSEALLDALMAA